MFITVIAFFVVLSILVLIHELGHFLTAKRLGIKVEEFGFGFPPRVLSLKIGETLYSINLLPIGGFVKLYGEDDAGGGSLKTQNSKLKTQKYDLKRAFFARPAWQRALVILAGVIMNFVLAVVLLSYLFAAKGVALPTENIKITDVAKGSPAEAVGLKSGDEVAIVAGKKITDTKEFISLTNANRGREIILKIKRGGREFSINVTPRKVVQKGEGPLGIAITNIEIKKYPWYSAPYFGTIEAFKFSFLILKGLVDTVGGLILGGGKP